MAGLLKNIINYDKEGPGVKKGESQKNRLIVFFQILGRKFWKLMSLNLIYCIFLVPILALCFLFLNFLPDQKTPNLLLIILCFAPTILLGPVNAAMTRLTRDFVREEPVFLLADFKDTVKKNWKQSLVISLIQYVSVFLLVNAGWLYYNSMHLSWFFVVGFAVCLFMSYVFVSMHFYVYLMQVTLKLNLRKMYKNAFYFTVLCLFKNILMIIILGTLIAGVGYLVILGMQYPQFIMPLLFLFLLLIAFALMFFIINFVTYPSLKKYVIDPYYEANPEETAGGMAKAQADIAENGDSNKQEGDSESEVPEYVYHNGRMIHRSVFENENLFDDK